ncbi:3-ketoacyl-ACP reductase [Fertoebacter nigrum]|uniref:3-ketoacyl-ACP reductase n=1 Tax=Fertoeibacter niger TaxID=2656921 RepID=A0A8X8GZN5_9RHOB|nr:3-ketoacyl-ACP reductase [Fertoeibacter niger]NUB44215.1 3-ketoacyl-ACP reductase [Fertoeibacter niger]
MTPLALVTGGQQGIGLGIATALAGAGFRIAIASLPAPDHPQVQAALTQLGPQTGYFQHDLALAEAVPALIDRIEAAMGPVSALVQNAGVAAPVRGDMLDITPANFDIVTGINLRGAFFVAQAMARRMITREAGPYRSITFITSVSARMASVERADYCISKAGAAMAAQALALRLAPLGIGVFELRPGIIATGMTEGVKDTYTARIAGGLVPAARWGQPADIGSVVVPIATGQMAFATGAVIPVDGGLSVQRL